MIRINPYRRNCEIMREFFSKPIFLITAVLLAVSNLLTFAVFILTLNPQVLNFTSVLLCISMFMFYFTAKSKKLSSFRGSTVMLDIVSIIGIAFSGLAVALFGVFCVILLLSLNSANPPASPHLNASILTLCSIFLVFSLVVLFYFIAMERLTISFKKSLTTVYLQRKGSVMFGIMSIILALTVVSVGVFFFLYSGDEPLTLIPFAFRAVTLILSAFIGFSYNSYIKKLSYNIETAKSEPVAVEDEISVAEQSNFQPTVTQPVEFTPESVFDKDVIIIPTVHKNPDNDNPYANRTKRCNNCGRENPSVNIFCGNCGNRL